MSRSLTTRWIIPAVAAIGFVWSGAGRAQDSDTGKKVGSKVDEVIQDIKGGFRKAGNAAKEQFSKAKVAVNNMGVESRVYGRIHWDRALNGAVIELSVEDGVVTLEGTVATAKAKLKAVELTKDTVGVTSVVDKLAVRPAAPITTPAP